MVKTDIAIVGGGLAGLVAAYEAVKRGRKVVLLDQEGPQSLGGQAFWSLGGLMMIDTPEQRRMGIRDSRDLAAQDWMGSAGFDRPEDANPAAWPRRIWISPPGRCGGICTAWGCAGFRWWAGPRGAGARRTGMAIRCHAFM